MVTVRLRLACIPKSLYTKVKVKMAAEAMKIDESRVGYLFDGIDDGLAPAAGTLKLTEGGLITVDLPSIRGSSDQSASVVEKSFAKTNRWGNAGPGKDLPPTMVFESADGPATLTGISWGGHHGGAAVSMVRLRADCAFFGKPRTIENDYEIQEMVSTIDGLKQFCRFGGFKFVDGGGDDHSLDSPIQTFPTETVEWESGNFHFRLNSRTASEGQESNYYNLTVHSEIATVANAPSSAFDHLAAQRKVRALLVLLFGCRLPWRSHSIYDSQFPTWFLSGDEGPLMRVPAILASTLREHSESSPTSSQLAFPAAYLSGITVEGLARWCDSLEDPDYRRAVEPAVEAIATEGAFLEPTIMMLTMALDRFGYCATGKHPRQELWTHICSCLDEAQVDWRKVGSNEGLAKFLADVNNCLKHPDRVAGPKSNGYPDTLAMVAAKELLCVAARAQALVAAGASDEVMASFHSTPSVRQTRQLFEDHGVAVDDNGILQP